MIEQLQNMDYKDLVNFFKQYKLGSIYGINIRESCISFIRDGPRALLDIQRQLTLNHANHEILEVIKTMPFYKPFITKAYYPEYAELNVYIHNKSLHDF